MYKINIKINPRKKFYYRMEIKRVNSSNKKMLFEKYKMAEF